MRHIERQNDFWTKKWQQLDFYPIWEYWIDVPLRIVKLESGGQQLPVTKKNLPETVLTLKNPLSY